MLLGCLVHHGGTGSHQSQTVCQRSGQAQEGALTSGDIRVVALAASSVAAGCPPEGGGHHEAHLCCWLHGSGPLWRLALVVVCVPASQGWGSALTYKEPLPACCATPCSRRTQQARQHTLPSAGSCEQWAHIVGASRRQQLEYNNEAWSNSRLTDWQIPSNAPAGM